MNQALSNLVDDLVMKQSLLNVVKAIEEKLAVAVKEQKEENKSNKTPIYLGRWINTPIRINRVSSVSVFVGDHHVAIALLKAGFLHREESVDILTNLNHGMEEDEYYTVNLDVYRCPKTGAAIYKLPHGSDIIKVDALTATVHVQFAYFIDEENVPNIEQIREKLKRAEEEGSKKF